MMNILALLARIKLHEGFRAKPYRDTQNILTIGYGRNLEASGISQEEGEYLLANDLKAALGAADGLVANFDSLTPARQEVIVEMAFNIGPKRLATFKKMLAAIEARDWEKAADEMLDSLWATQVKQRAVDLAALMRKG